MHVPVDWADAAKRIGERADKQPLVMVVGAPDVGKSTFCAYLASRFAQAGARVGVVDCDIGQSSIGPPTAISGGVVHNPIAALTEIPTTAGSFVGAISPVGHLLPCVIGAHRVAQRLREQGATVILVDTSGLVHGSAGLSLKEHKRDLLQPSDAVIIQRQGELAHLVRRWQHTTTRVHVLSPSPSALQRSPADRRAYRSASFAAYFAGARPITISWEEVSLRNTWLQSGQALGANALNQIGQQLQQPLVYGERHGDRLMLIAGRTALTSNPRIALPPLDRKDITVWPAQRFAHVVCGLLDARGDLIRLAILQHVGFDTGAIQLLAPPLRPVQKAQSVYLGRLLLRADGVELGVLRPGDL